MNTSELSGLLEWLYLEAGWRPGYPAANDASIGVFGSGDVAAYDATLLEY
jgi:hypothetical protein